MAAQDAELKLKVSLDLAFFRQQLAGLGQAAAGYNMPINVRFDRRAVQNELNALGTNIRRRNYSLEVKTNLDTEIKKAKDLADALRDLPKAQKAQGIAGVTGERFSQAALRKLGQDIKPLYKAAAEAGIVAFNDAIANNVGKIAKELSEVGKESIAGLLNGLKSGDAQVKAAAESLGKALISSIKGILGIASPSKVFKAIGDDVGKGFELGATASMDRAFDELERKIQQRLGKLQDMLRMPASRRSAFPFVAMGGAPESGPIAREIDQAYAQLAQIRERRQGRLTFERESLAQAAGRLLPPGRDRSLPAGREVILPGGGALDKVTQGFIRSLRDTRDTLARNFSANTYLPKATRALATSMSVATKQLSGTNVAGLLPSKEMMEPLRFQRAQQRAAQIDAENIARQQAQRAAEQANLRGMFKGLPPLTAPMIGAENAPLSRAASYMLNKANRALGLPMGPSSPIGSMGRFPMSGMMGRGSMGQFPMDDMLAIGGPSAMGQSRAGSTPWLNTLRGSRGFIPSIKSSFRFPMSGMMGPSSPLGTITPQSSMFAGGGGAVPPSGGGGGGGGAGRGGALAFPGGNMGQSSQLPPGYHFLGTLPANLERAQQFLNQRTLPLTSAIKDLAGEFGHAAQQVLLYGTAYKALAFFTSLPGQAFEAAKGLETFRNQLAAVTDSTGQFGPSLKFIENSVKELNIPIESAREGFTRLFASLQPAGFDPGTIQNLFGGITKAAATFGLSADQVDRVFYAFGQMASKGQVMSEELKGQLGDVLPGSVALFAEAAKMSMTEFSQALEDGMFKGDAMKVLLENVATLMSTKFSDAATKASQTLQGQMNAMQNSLKLMYESLQPMVNAFAAAVGPVIQSMISDATEVIKAFTSNVVIGGEAFGLMTPRAQDFYSTLKNLVPSIVAAAKNIGEFGKSLSIFVSPLVTAVKLVSDFIAIPFVGRIALYATTIGGLTTAFQLLVSTGIVQAIASMIRFMSTLSLAQISTWIAVIRSAIASLVAMARTADLTRLSLVALKVTLISFGVGAVLMGLDYVIQRLMGIGDAANKARQRVAGLTDELNRAVEAGDTATASERYVQAETRVQSIEKATAILERLKTGPQKISKAEFETLQRTGLASGINYFGGTASGGTMQVKANLEAARQGRIQALNEAGQAQEAMRDAAEVAANRQRQIDAQRRELKDIPPGTGDENGKKGKRTPLKQILDFESQRQSEMALSEKMLRLSTLIRDAKLSGNEAEAKSLESLSGALKITNQIQAAQKFIAMLIDKEAEIAGKSLTPKEFTNKLEDAKVELYKLQNDLQIEFNELQVKEADAAKDAQDELNKKVEKQKQLNRLIEDAQIAAGIISPREAAIKLQQREFEDAQARVEAEGSPEQLTQLKAAQALIPEAGSIQETMKTLREELDKLLSAQEMVKFSAASIGEAFSTSFKDAITGAATAQEALAGFFRSVGNAFADMAAQMIQKMIQMYVLDQFLNILPGGGMFKGNASIQGGGFGSFSGGAFGIDSAGALGQVGQNLSITPFANGGIVTGPTMGLVGEGRYNEAVVPLPDGKTIPVDLGNAAGNQIVSNITVNVNNGQAQSNASGSNSSDLGRKLEGAVKQVIVGELRPGGLLAR